MALYPPPRSRSSRVNRPPRRWEQVSWAYSALFAIAILLLVVTVIASPSGGGSGDSISLRITDAATGTVLEGAEVHIGGEIHRSDADGIARFAPPAADAPIRVSLPGYADAQGVVPAGATADQSIGLQSAGSSAPTPDPTATSAPMTAEPTAAPTATPTDAPAATGNVFTGKVVDSGGKPVREAMIRIGTTWTLTNKKGVFTIDIPPGAAEAEVSASGYADQSVPLTESPTIELVEQEIRGVYLTAANAADPAKVQYIIDLASRSLINAVVIDIKDTAVFYDTGVEFFHGADAVYPVYDPRAIVETFQSAGIYVIARLVVFKDPLVAEAYPELAVIDESTGGLWYGWQGEAWVDPFETGLWQPNIDLALEAAEIGFDEIQYDYIRFPSDGDLSVAAFNGEYTEEGRVAAISEFLRLSHEALRPTGAKLAADVFGIIAVLPDDQGIGQRFQDVTEHLDYVCPMVYPSHFDAGAMFNVDGAPNDYPYEVILGSMQTAASRIPGMERKMRPWLQDFSLAGMTPYDAWHVRVQIDAAIEAGSSGWMLWNPDNVYTEGAIT